MYILKVSLVLSVIAIANGYSVTQLQLYGQLAERALKPPETYLQAIIPGTKWCGDGDKAENNDELGFFKVLDMCCRDHDNCDDYIPAGTTKHGLYNNGSYSRLHCKCDYEFFDCLKDADKMGASIVGIGYFNVLGGQCYSETYPASCIEYKTFGFRKRCVDYSYDKAKPMEWQWFDVPRYIET